MLLSRVVLGTWYMKYHILVVLGTSRVVHPAAVVISTADVSELFPWRYARSLQIWVIGENPPDRNPLTNAP